MGAYYLSRFLFIITTLFVSALITFIIMHATPGGPWDTSPDSRTSDPRVQERLDKAYGLDKPLFINIPAMQEAQAAGKRPLEVTAAVFDAQFEIWLVNFVQGKMGPSYRFRGRNVEDILLEPTSLEGSFWQNRLMATMILGLVATFIAVIIVFPLGVIASVNQNTLIDNLSLIFDFFFNGSLQLAHPFAGNAK